MLQKKKANTSSKVIAAGIAGAALGAAGVLMSNKKNREIVEKKLEGAKKWSNSTVGEIKNRVDKIEAFKKVDKPVDKAKDLEIKAEDLSEKEASNLKD